MNEHDFRQAYEAIQHDMTASTDLKQRTLAAAERAASTDTPQHVSARPSSKQPHRRAGQRSPQIGGAAAARRWGLPAAACLVAAAIVAGGVPVIIGMINANDSTAITIGDAQTASGFSVRAWAADSSSMLELGNDGTVVFARNTNAGMPTGDDYQTEGYFTGCLFRVEGDNIARVQMNISKGELYRFTSERFTRSEEPEKWSEALSWKPTERGTGTYFSKYDAVLPVSTNDGLPKDSPDKGVGVDLSKRLGSTIDVSAQDDPGIASGDTSFGLWTNEPYGSDTDSFSAVVDLFDGQTLTVTVTFDDGHTSTQVIELHAADFRAEHNGSETTIIPEQVDRSQLTENESYVHTLYGTVIEANKEAFPLPLDGANNLADDLLPATVLERNEETRSTGVALSEDALLGNFSTCLRANTGTCQSSLT